MLTAMFMACSVMTTGSPARAQGTKAATTAAGTPRSDYRFAVETFDTASSVYYPGWNGYSGQIGNAICDMLTTEMVKSGRDMVERSRLKDAIAEQDLGQSGRLDKSTAPEVGKIVGADYLIVGTVTEWGYKEQAGGVAGGLLHGFGGVFGKYGGAARYKATDAEVKIDYRIINSRTGRIVTGSANTAQGDEKTGGVALQSNWYNSIDFSQTEWTETQIGKATRKAVQQIAEQLRSWSPNDGGAEPDRPALNAKIVALVSPDEFVIDQGASAGVRVGDTVDVTSVTPIKNRDGKVVYETEARIGSAKVVEVQPDGAKIRLSGQTADGPKVKEGDAVHPPALPSATPHG